jgi:hypothetical protein
VGAFGRFLLSMAETGPIWEIGLPFSKAEHVYHQAGGRPILRMRER